MRNLLPALYWLVLLVGLACADETPKSARERDNLVGPVRRIRIDQVTFSTRDGAWVAGPRLPSYAACYAVDGHLTETLYYGEDGRPEKTTWLYDEKGNEVEQASHKSDGSLQHKLVKHYDTQGRVTQEDFYSVDGKMYMKEIYSYNAEGHLTEQASYSVNPTFYNGKTVIKCDAVGRWIEAADYDFDGAPGMKQTLTYDAQGRVIEETDYLNPRDIEVKTIHRYNLKGQEVEELSYPHGAFLGSRDRYTYDTIGNRIRNERWLYDARGTVTGKWVGVYDAKGNETDDLSYGPDGRVKRHETSIYEFDAIGNWTKQTVKKYVVQGGKAELAEMKVRYQTVAYYREPATQPVTPHDD